MTAHQQNIGWTVPAQRNAEAIRDLMGLPEQRWRSAVILAALVSWQEELEGKTERTPLEPKTLRLFVESYIMTNWTDEKQKLPAVNIYMKPEVVSAVKTIGQEMERVGNISYLGSNGEQGYNVTMIVQVALEKYRKLLELTV